MKQRTPQSGAILLLAMLAVALIASLTAAALWRQWRSVETERAERERAQMVWVLNGALDWARLILMEDARAGTVDHLSEPWAIPLQEAKLGSFLAAGSQEDTPTLQAYLSGSISDEQALLNVSSLVVNGQVQLPMVGVFRQLFRALGLPPSELQALLAGLETSSAAGTVQKPGDASTATPQPLPPTRWAQLAFYGLSPGTLARLAPFATLLPAPTPVNVNTASPTVLQALFADVDPARLQQFVQRRLGTHFKTIDEVQAFLKSNGPSVDNRMISTDTHFFTVRGRLRLDQTLVQERSLLQRDGRKVSILWRQREPVTND